MEIRDTRGIDPLTKARQLAAEGPRVSALITDGVNVDAVAGYIESNTEKLIQVALITPDGRVWLPGSEKDIANYLRSIKKQLEDMENESV